MTEQQVCNINFYLYTRFLFGFYHKFQASERAQWMARCFCCFSSAVILFFLCQICVGFYPLSLIFILTAAEYVSYVLIAFRKNNEYLLEYYKKMLLVDDITYKPMRWALIVYMYILFFMKLLGLIVYLALYQTESRSLFPILELAIWCAVVIGRSPVLFVFALLYTRVKSMRKKLESHKLECRNQGANHPRQYIQMYEAIMDGLEKTDGPVKLQLFIFIVLSTTFYLFMTTYTLYVMRHYGSSGVTDTNGLMIFLYEAILGYSPLFLSAILADMVSMEVQEILAIVVERRIACNNERDRAEIQKLFQLVRDHPFEYRLWRVVPLNLRCLLSFLSFSIITIIAILQINALNSTT